MMSSVLPYARARLRALGFTEWHDGFNFDNIPSPALDKAFHVTVGTAQGQRNNQSDQEIRVPFTVRVFKRASRNPKGLIDESLALGDSIVSDLMASQNRLTQPGIKNIYFDTLTPEPLDASNDNGVRLRIEFTALVIISAH